VGRAAVSELDYKGRYFRDFVRACLVPMAFVAICCTLFLVYSKQIALALHFISDYTAFAVEHIALYARRLIS
jgi:hypothetical protein